jgi:glutaredoxin
VIHTIFYSTGCPKCKILKSKLDEKNIPYEICSDPQIMIDKGFKTVPMLEVNNKIMNYTESVNWIKEQNS